jgi:pimeloyl-ACP methyl ester carboxylesterase
MKTVTSADGTTIAFDQTGQGPAIILVGGAIQHRAIDPGTAQLAGLLSSQFTVIHYDRRGRGDSGDTLPFAIEREIEDLDALIDSVGGSASLFGMSSGGALVIETALALGPKVKKIAVYEVPYNSDAAARQAWRAYSRGLDDSLAANRRGDMATRFLALVGTPAEQIDGMRQTPVWSMFEAVAPTLTYDAAVLGEEADVPIAHVGALRVPTLVLHGSATYPFMAVTAAALTEAIPGAQHVTLEGQTHNVDPAVLAPVLERFFST